MAYGSMKTCYFTQWDVAKCSNCTWAHGESLCPQSHALTSAFKCHPKQRGRAFFLSCLSLQLRHKPCYMEAEETKEHLSATLVLIVELVEVLSMMVRSDPSDTWHCTAEYNSCKEQVLLRRCNLFSLPIFSGQSWSLSQHTPGSWQSSRSQGSHSQFFPCVQHTWYVFTMLEVALRPQGEAATSIDKTGRWDSSILIWRVKSYTSYKEPPDITLHLIPFTKNSK